MAVVDLFCGCGGLSKGFEAANFNVVAAFDCWQPALTCYNHNFNHPAHELDLNDVEKSVNKIREYNPEMIIGGPPCQEFSNAGRRQEGAIADLTYKYAQIITSIMPRFFVMENVSRAKDSDAFAKARKLYKEYNYGLTEVVLDASRCGVPQKRKRFFCIGELNTPDNFLSDRIFANYTLPPVSVREYFAAHEIELGIDAYYRHPTTYNRRAVFSVDEVAPTIRGVNRPKPQTYQRHEKDAVSEENLPNITQLTIRQRASIQTFPKDFQFEDLGLTRCDIDQLIGNAVPVLLARFIATQIRDYIQGGNPAMNDRQAFSTWLRTEKGYSDRSISDVFSRIKRATSILPNRVIDRYYIVDLERTQQYQSLNTSVRSQIRKALNLRIAYFEASMDHNHEEN